MFVEFRILVPAKLSALQNTTRTLETLPHS